MKRSLRTVAESVQAQVIGDSAVEVSGIASIAQARPGDLVFVEDEKSLQSALESRAAAIIVGEFAKAELSNAGLSKNQSSKNKTSPKPLLISKHPRLAFVRAARLLCPASARPPGTHPQRSSPRVGPAW